ncbi:MAG: DNA replication/repair protein RecF [Oscillospiraceae bacterium]|nr:DNA replication/repair protein RecF [Oscillospiraceae bacterium]
MHVTAFAADGFKNLHSVSLVPDPKLNLIIGDNAQGKTNLLDAIWLMTGCRSFHGVRERHYLGTDAPYFRCEMRFFDGQREQHLCYLTERGASRRRRISVNGVDGAKTGGLFELFHCIAFAPFDVELINGAPDVRRAFLDLGACQLRRGSISRLNTAQHLLMQRNAAIQTVLHSRGRREDIALWDAPLAAAGTAVCCMRSAYVRALSPIAAELYSMMTGGHETLALSYRSAVFGNEALPEEPEPALTDRYREALAEGLAEDLRLGHTRRGFQRDELQITVDGLPVQSFGSQGQRKSAALVLKLAQAHLYRQKRHMSPVVLLDDVMGELDERRQQLLYSLVEDMQVFITLCNPSSLRLDRQGSVFVMEQGRLRPLGGTPALS